jgi:hypothetical protein
MNASLNAYLLLRCKIYYAPQYFPAKVPMRLLKAEEKTSASEKKTRNKNNRHFVGWR